MAKIDIDVETIRSSASTLEAKVNELKVMRFNLFKLINNINDTWDGEASEVYINKLEGYLIKIDNMVDIYIDYKKYLDDVADKFENLDASCITVLKKMAQIATDVVTNV